MAIQIRRGAATDFDSTKMVSGELAVSTDGSHKVWATGAAGDCWELVDKEDVTQVKQDIAPAYSTSSTYAVGDYVLYNNALYRCTTAIATAEAWTAAHWTAVNVGGELTQYKQDNDELENQINDVAGERISALEIEWEYGSFSTSTGEPINNGSAAFSRCPIYWKESELNKISNPNGLEMYGYRYTYDGTTYTFVSAFAIYGSITEYTFSSDSNYYFRFGGRITLENRQYVTLTGLSKIVSDVKQLTTAVPVLKESVDDILIRNSASDEWGIGTMNSGVYDPSNNKRITDKNYIPIFNGCAVTVSPLLYVIHSYDADKNFIEATSWIASGTRTVINNNAVYIRIVAKVSDGYVFTDDDLVTYANCINIEYPINDCVQVLRSTQPNMDGVKAEIFDNVLVNSFNSAYHTGATNWAAKCAEYSQLINNSDHVECFLFFTDPHFFTRTDADWQNKLPEFIAEMQKYYNSTPTSFCLCGGDWLTEADSNATALFRLGYIDGFMNAMFDNYYPMFGNHDDNYQGATVDGGTPATATPLEKQTVVNLWFKKFGKAYYTFEGTSTKFYVFDSGNDWNTNMTEYRWEQIDWFATALLTETSERIAVSTHIAYNTTSDYTSGTLFPMTDNIGKIIQAYNNKTSVTLNGKSYDYTSASGSVKFIIAGHLHADGVKTVYGVPLIITTNTLAVSTEPTFDMVYVDYDSDVIKLVRVGSGTSRTVNM